MLKLGWFQATWAGWTLTGESTEIQAEDNVFHPVGNGEPLTRNKDLTQMQGILREKSEAGRAAPLRDVLAECSVAVD